MTVEEFKKEWLNGFELDINQLDEMLKQYAKAKCQELLEIMVEKAEIKSENAGKINERLIIDKDSILNCVDLEKFCS